MRVNQDRIEIHAVGGNTTKGSEEALAQDVVADFELSEQLARKGGQEAVAVPKIEGAKPGKVGRRESGGGLERDVRYECCELDQLWHRLVE